MSQTGDPAVDSRGASTAVSHVLAIGITTILVAGLLVSANAFVTGQQESATADQLAAIGGSLAGELERADRLARQGGDVTIRNVQPSSTSVGAYTARVANGTECTSDPLVNTTSCLVMSADGGSVTETLALKNETPVALRRSDGGFVVTARNGETGFAARRTAVYPGIGIGRGIDRGNADLTGDPAEDGGFDPPEIAYNRDGTAVDVPGDGTVIDSGVRFSVRNEFADPVEVTHVTVFPADDRVSRLDEGGDGTGDYSTEILVRTGVDDGRYDGAVDLPNGVRLDDNATIGGGGTAEFLLYEFTDGGVPVGMTGQNVTVVIDYRLRDGRGTYGSERFDVDLADSDNQVPTAAFTPTPSRPNVGEAVTFDASAAGDVDGTVAQYRWDFPDGTTRYGETVTRRFANARPYDVTLTVTDDDGASASSVRTVYVDDVVAAVNAGGSRYVSASGVSYAADNASERRATEPGSRTGSTGDAIDGTAEDRLYQTYRYSGDPEQVSYEVAVPADGEYRVTLLFVEPYFTGDDDRVFDVRVEGRERIADLDVHAEVGHDRAYVRRETVTVTDGTLSIAVQDDETNTNYAILSGFRVELVDADERVTWGSAVDWDAARSEVAVVHGDHGDHQADKLELGYPSGRPGEVRWDADPVAYWSLDDGATDVGGDGNDGTLQGGVTPTDRGVANTGAYEFDGTDDYVDVNLVADDLANSAYTWSAWVRSTGADEDTVVGANERNRADAVRLSLRDADGDGDAGAAVNDGGWTGTGTTLTDGDWHHVAVTRTSADRGAVYVDGSRESTFTFDDGRLRPSTRVQLGMEWGRAPGEANGPGNHFDGVVDEVRMYDEALSADAVRNLSLVGRRGSIVTAEKSAGATMTASDLQVRYDASVNGGRVDVKVVAGDGTESDWLNLTASDDGTSPVDLPEGTLSDDDDYRLVVVLVSPDAGRAPQVDELTLEED